MEFKLQIKNLVLSDSKGCDLMKEIVVRATSRALKQVSHSLFLAEELKRFDLSVLSFFFQVWMWSKGKFVNRKFLMEELYQQHQLQNSTGNVICWGKKIKAKV